MGTAHDANATADDATVVCPARETVNGEPGAVNVAVACATSTAQVYAVAVGRNTCIVVEYGLVPPVTVMIGFAAHVPLNLAQKVCPVMFVFANAVKLFHVCPPVVVIAIETPALSRVNPVKKTKSPRAVPVGGVVAGAALVPVPLSAGVEADPKYVMPGAGVSAAATATQVPEVIVPVIVPVLPATGCNFSDSAETVAFTREVNPEGCADNVFPAALDSKYRIIELSTVVVIAVAAGLTLVPVATAPVALNGSPEVIAPEYAAMYPPIQAAPVAANV